MVLSRIKYVQTDNIYYNNGFLDVCYDDVNRREETYMSLSEIVKITGVYQFDDMKRSKVEGIRIRDKFPINVSLK